MCVLLMVVILTALCVSSAHKSGSDTCQLTPKTRGVCLPYSACPSAQFAEFFDDIEPLPCKDQTSTTKAVCCDARRKSIQMCDIYWKLKPRVSSVVGGRRVRKQRYPHVVALGYRSAGSEDYNYRCAGSLVSEVFVLTAAHCVHTRYGTPQVIRVGDVDLTAAANNDSIYAVAEAMAANNGTTHTQYNDVALLRLSTPVRLGRRVFPACLFSQAEAPSKVTVVGWGSTDASGLNPSGRLLEARLSVTTHSVCRSFYNMSRTLPSGLADNMVCAVDPAGVKDACRGDSGGPLQTPSFHGRSSDVFAVVGVTSFGKYPCAGRRPGVYTSVYHFLDWIEERVWPQHA